MAHTFGLVLAFLDHLGELGAHLLTCAHLVLPEECYILVAELGRRENDDCQNRLEQLFGTPIDPLSMLIEMHQALLDQHLVVLWELKVRDDPAGRALVEDFFA